MKKLQLKAAPKNYILLNATSTQNSKDTFSLSKAVTTFLQSAKKVLHILGDSGSGKTCFAAQLAAELWQQRADDHSPIPLVISLSKVSNPAKAIQLTLKEFGFSKDQIEALRKQYKFVFIVDGLDQINRQFFLFDDNARGKWKGHVILLSRPENNLNRKKREERYSLWDNDKPLRELYDEVWIAPFSDAQIQNYLAQVPEQQIGMQPQLLLNLLTKNEAIKPLAQKPFFLMILINALPEILAKRAGNIHHAAQLTIPQSDILEAYVESILLKAAQRLKNDPLMIELQMESDFKQDCLNFLKKQAVKMKSNDTSIVVIDDFNKYAPLYLKTGLLKIVDSDDQGRKRVEFENKILLEYFLFLAGKSKMPGIIIQQVDENKEEKGADKIRVVQPAQVQIIVPSLEDLPINLSNGLINGDPLLIQLYAEEVQKNPAFQNVLFGLVERSKHDVSFAIAAANAMTILNAAKCTFSLKDFSGAHIPGARLKGAICHRTNFEKADVSDVEWTNAILDESNFSGARVGGISFGHEELKLQSYIPSNSKENPIRFFSQDGQRFAENKNGFLCVWEVKTGKLLLREQLFGLQFSNDGRKVYITKLNRLYEFDLTTKSETPIQYDNKYFPATNPVSSSSGKYLACAFNAIRKRGQEILVWDKSNGSLKSFDSDKVWFDTVQAYYFSSDETLLISVTSMKIFLLDLKTAQVNKAYNIINIGEKIDEPGIIFQKTISSSCLSKDGRYLITGLKNGLVIKWDLAQDGAKMNFEGHNTEITACTLSPNNDRLATLGKDSVLRLWDTTNGKVTQIIPGAGLCQFSENGAFISFVTKEGYMSTYAVADDPLLILDSIPPLARSTIIPNGKKVVGLTTTNNPEALIFDLEKRKILKRFKLLPDYSSNFHHDPLISPSGKYLTFPTRSGSLQLIDSDTYEETVLKLPHETYNAGLGLHWYFSKDEKKIVASSLTQNLHRVIHCWDITSKQLINSSEPFGGVYSFTKINDQFVAIVRQQYNYGDFFTYNIETKNLSVLQSISTYPSVQYFNDGVVLVAWGYIPASQKHSLTVWDAKNNGKVLFNTLTDSDPGFSNVVVSPDNKRIVFINNNRIQVAELDGKNNVLESKDMRMLGNVVTTKDFFFNQSGQLVTVFPGKKGENSRIIVWELDKGTIQVDTRLPISIASFSYSKSTNSFFIQDHNNESSSWQYFEDGNRKPFLCLTWSSLPSLRANNANFEGAVGLSEQDANFLQAHGANKIRSVVSDEVKE